MNKVWQEPQVMVQPFVANEYVAACGDGHVTYNFTCDAGLDENGKPITHDINYSWPIGSVPTKYIWRVFTDSGRELTSVGGWDGDKLYGPCGATHKADSQDEFLSGYMDDYYTDENEKIKVIIWTGSNKDNIHCTKNLNMSTWTTAKS